MVEEEIDLEAEVEKYKKDFLKKRGSYDDNAPTLLKIPGLERLKLSDVYFPNETSYLAMYARGFQIYRLSGTNYGVVAVILVNHYDQDEFYNTKEYDESIYEKLEIQWINLKLSNAGESAGKMVLESKVLHFNEILDNCPKEITSGLLYYIDLFTKNKES